MIDITEYNAGIREEIRGGEVVAIHAASMELLTAQERELAVTSLIERAGAQLQQAVDAGEPAEMMAAYKDQAAAIADLAKRLDVSKDAVLNAQVLQRRAERGLGLAIRAGQEAGEITSAGTGGTGAQASYTQIRNGKEVLISASKKSVPDRLLARPTDFASHAQLAGAESGIYAMSDTGTEEDFTRALGEARAEKNVSRANVVRKLKAAAAPVEKPVVMKAPSRAEQTAITKSNDILDRVSLAIEVNAQAVDHINVDHITKEQAVEALERFTTALPILNKLSRELKKGIQ